jgi:hypothetical protein
MMAHGFRKFFKTQLVKARVDPELRELLLGHSKRKLDHVYTRLTPDEVQQEYEKAIDALTIDPSNRLRKKVEKLEVEKTQIQTLALELEKVKKAIAVK